MVATNSTAGFSRDAAANASTPPSATLFKTPVGVDVKAINKAADLVSNYSPSTNPKTKVVIGADLTNYLWNLPPHSWSLPVEPRLMDPIVVNTQNFDPDSSSLLRRGRIYYFSRVDSEFVATEPNTGKDPRYGFQFLWNPETFSTTVSVNMDITPTSNDKFAKVVGAFPSGEMLSLTLRIDRTNDFFCIRSLNRSLKTSTTTSIYGNTYDDVAQDMTSYYLQAASFERNFTKTAVSKIKDLQTRGTLADIEYLYKAINGPGWTNAATGKETSDIGFLRPTLLRIDIGPVSYIGYVTNIGVTHTSFTKGMIPMRSDVALQFNLMATAGIASSGTLVSN